MWDAPKRVRGRLREVYIDLGVYPTSVWVVVGPFSDLRRYLDFRRPGSNLPDVEALGCCWGYNHNQGPLIWIKTVSGPMGIGALAHEALHAMYYVGENLGITLKEDSQETFAYGISHIIKTVLKEVRKC